MKSYTGKTIGLDDVIGELRKIAMSARGKVSPAGCNIVAQQIDALRETIETRGEHVVKKDTRATFGDARLIVSDELLEYAAEKTPERVVVNGVEYRPSARTQMDVRTLDGDFTVPGARWTVSDGVLQTYDLSGLSTGVFSVARLVCARPKRIAD
jgi:hypothetical protein